jgi:hypothetical protein
MYKKISRLGLLCAKYFIKFIHPKIFAAHDKWNKFTNTEKKYFISGGFALLSLAIPVGAVEKQILLLLSGFGFLAGLLPQLISIMKALWSSGAGKFFILAINGGVLYFSRALAKQKISEIIGLPAADFDGTVGWITIFYACRFWVYFAIVVLTLASICLPIMSLIGILTSRYLRLMGDAISITILMSLISAASWNTDRLFDERLVKRSLYYLDYFKGDRLINLDSNEKIFIHPNKSISIAKISPNGNVEIHLYQELASDKKP